MSSINQYLKEHTDLNLKERMMVYGGPLIGIIAPVTYVRYMGFGDSDGDLKRESLYWIGSFMAAIPLLANSVVMGTVVGISAAIMHKSKRIDMKLSEKEDLETKVTNGN